MQSAQFIWASCQMPAVGLERSAQPCSAKSTVRAQPLRLGLRSLAGDASRASSLGASRSLLWMFKRQRIGRYSIKWLWALKWRCVCICGVVVRKVSPVANGGQWQERDSYCASKNIAFNTHVESLQDCRPPHCCV